MCNHYHISEWRTYQSTLVAKSIGWSAQYTVYKVPPRTSNAGYRAMEWGDLAQHLWKGRMRIIESAKTCAIRLEDSSTG